MSDKKVLVIGGGASGCAAAWEAARLGYGVVLVEAEKKLGGLASNLEINENIYEYGTHVFHTDKPTLLKKIRDLMGLELQEIERGSRLSIKFLDRYFAYPLKGTDLVKNLPLDLGVKAGLSFLKSFLMYDCIHRTSKPRNTEEYIIQKFGRVLYDIFFREYTEKVWGIPCSALDPIFGEQRIPRTDIFSIFKKILDHLNMGRIIDPHPLCESVIGNIYYTERGIGRLFEKMGDEIKNMGGEILTGAKLKQLITSKNRIQRVIISNKDSDIEYTPDYVISTIPLPILTQCFKNNIPHDVQEAGRKLKYRALSVQGILVSKPQVSHAFMTYYNNLSFNRLSEPSNHGLKVKPEGHTLLLVETVCGYGDRAYRGDATFREAVLNEIVREGLVAKKEIIEEHHYAWQYAYPLYEIGFKKNVEKMHAFLNSLGNIHSTGRNGNFCYVNMHVAMQMGFESVEIMQKYIDHY